MSRIHLSKADVSEVEEQYVLDAVRSGWVTPLGPHVDAFETEVAARVGAVRCLALTSGTAALHLGLLLLGAGPGTAVMVPSLTFAASANAVMYTGAQPVFVDSQTVDGNVHPGLLAEAVDKIRAEGLQVVAAMSVDLFGRCADYNEILGCLGERGIPLLEDAAESFGGSYQGRPAGSFGAAAAFSFNGNKIMTTSGGGMLVSHDVDLVERARYLSAQARQPAEHYQHTEIGFNYRLSNVLAALGRAQLTRLDSMIARRRAIREHYLDALAEAPGVRFLGSDDEGHDDREDNCWLTCMELDPHLTRTTPSNLIARLATQDIESRRIWKPMHLQPVFAASCSFTTGVAERLFLRGVALPSGSNLHDGEVERVIDAVKSALGKNG
ncbi:MAG: DegT/DnrJ/EryC1/StrS family aminotransferase [Actinomycetota bacterium]|nr:DegT/DnrJ/EryC1/StrS family aminotransferase [Actinomycetota bacterium]